jgi:molecular chaperone DnaJ
MTLKECYNILGLARTARLEDVKHAYRRRAFELHPDLNPHLVDAAYQFQVLNEAYVTLLKVLPRDAQPAGPDTSAPDEKNGAGPERAENDRGGDTGDTGHAREQARESGPDAGGHAGKAEADGAGDPAQAAPDGARGRSGRKAGGAYARHEAVLNDILNDPFARRVFEDIYREAGRHAVQEAVAAPVPKKPAPARKLHLEWGDKIVNFDLTGGMKHLVGGWLRSHIDDTLTVRLPHAKLFPGARVRLHIRQSLQRTPRVVELVLPQDFRAGKAIRLKGMGKKLGKWTGDLYLTIEAEARDA